MILPTDTIGAIHTIDDQGRPSNGMAGRSRKRYGSGSAAVRSLALVLTLSLAPAAVRADFGRPGDQPRLLLRPRAIDFGKAGHLERPSRTLTVENVGSAPLVIASVEASCDCIRVAPKSARSVAPGDSARFEVSMGSGRAMGSLSKRITLKTNDPKAREVAVPVRMSVLAEFRMEPRQVRFTGAFGGDPMRAHVDITSPSGEPIELEVVEIEGLYKLPGSQFLRADVSPRERTDQPVGKRNGKRITVTLDPNHPEGRIAANVRARLNGRTLVLPVTGEMFAGILVDPKFVNFSRAAANDAATLIREVRLSSIDGAAFNVRGTEVRPSRGSGDRASLEIKVHGSPSRKVYRLTLRLIPGKYEKKKSSFYGKVEVDTDHPKKPKLVLSYSGFFTN